MVAPHAQDAPPHEDLLNQAKAEIQALHQEVNTYREPLQKFLADNQWKQKAGKDRVTSAAWYWVEFENNGQWQALDPYSDEAAVPKDGTLAKPYSPNLKIDITMNASDGKRTSVLTWEGPASNLAGMDATLMWFPIDERIKKPDAAQVPLAFKVAKWQPVLRRNLRTVITSILVLASQHWSQTTSPTG